MGTFWSVVAAAQIQRCLFAAPRSEVITSNLFWTSGAVRPLCHFELPATDYRERLRCNYKVFLAEKWVFWAEKNFFLPKKPDICTLGKTWGCHGARSEVHDHWIRTFVGNQSEEHQEVLRFEPDWRSVPWCAKITFKVLHSSDDHIARRTHQCCTRL